MRWSSPLSSSGPMRQFVLAGTAIVAVRMVASFASSDSLGTSFVPAGSAASPCLRGSPLSPLRGAASSEGRGDAFAGAPRLAAAAACSSLIAIVVALRAGRTRATARCAEGKARGPTARRAEPQTVVEVEPNKTSLVTDVDPRLGPEGTYKVGIDFASWLVSCTEELHVRDLRVEGALPVWLSGSLTHAGPAKFEFGEDSFVDWVDGQGMLYRLQIDGNGACEYRNQWLESANHKAHREAGRIAVRETCSRPTIEHLHERLAYMTQPPLNENGNLHISQIANGSRSISMSVGSEQVEFKLGDLETLGKMPFDDEISKGGPLIFHAEPEIDPSTGEWFSLSIQLFPRPEEVTEGWKPEYVLYSIPPTTNPEPGSPVQRRTICRIASEYPSPVHNISLTEKYIVIAQIPYPLNWDGMLNAESKWLWTGKYDGNLNDYNTWQPERPTIFHVINRETGEVKKTFETDPWFFFHTVNAYEDGDVINLDIITYKEPPTGFPLEQARSGDVEEWRGGGGGEVRRFRLDLAEGGELTFDRWRNNCFDEPKINHKYNGQKHRYSYGCQDDNGMLRLVKLDHDEGTIKYWEEQDTSRELPWQPSFVAEPYSDKEDAGVLMCFVRDQPTGNNFCVVLDTETMKEKARIHLPEGHHIPLHGHGTFFPGQYVP